MSKIKFKGQIIRSLNYSSFFLPFLISIKILDFMFRPRVSPRAMPSPHRCKTQKLAEENLHLKHPRYNYQTFQILLRPSSKQLQTSDSPFPEFSTVFSYRSSSQLNCILLSWQRGTTCPSGLSLGASFSEICQKIKVAVPDFGD